MKELLSGLIGPVTGIINKVVPDKDEAARLAYEISTMADRHAQELAVDQIEVHLTPLHWLRPVTVAMRGAFAVWPGIKNDLYSLRSSSLKDVD